MILNEGKLAGEGLTFDDVLLLPAYSEVLPREVDIKTKLTRNISINVPLVSAAMDTVTEFDVAIAMAREGGLGFIHKNMSIEKQAEQVRKVKRSESGLIIDPITLKHDATIGAALAIMNENKIGGIPIVDDSGNLVGILTNRDLRFEHNTSLPVSAVMTKDRLVTAPKGTSLKQAAIILHEPRLEKLPVVDVNKLRGLITYRDIMTLKLHPNSCKAEFGRLQEGAVEG